MIESPLDDHDPGQVVRFGWPYHGRMFMPDVFGGVTYLQAGPVTIPLPKVYSRDRRAQPGSCFRFRDPRAQEYVPSYKPPPGVRWQADVLCSPAGVVYCKRQFATVHANWVFHDGERNWIAEWVGAGEISFTSTPVIWREDHRPGDAVEQRFLTPTVIDPDDGFSYAGTVSVLVDVTAQGNRALFALYAPEDAREEAPLNRCRLPLKMYELVIGRDSDGVMQATYTCIRGSAAMMLVRREYKPAIIRTTGLLLNHWWGDGGVYVDDGEPATYAFFEEPSSSAYVTNITPEQAPSWTRIVSMYYDAQGTPHEIRLDVDTHIEEGATFAYGVDSFDPGGFNTAPSVLDYRTVESRSGSMSATVTLTRAGEVVSTMSISGSASWVRTRMHHETLPSGNPQPVPETLEGAYQYSVRVDGAVAGEVKGDGPDSVTVAAFQANLAKSVFELPFMLIGRDTNEFPAFQIEVARYSSSMLAFGVLDAARKEQKGPWTRYRYSVFTVTHPGGTLPGRHDYGLGWAGELFGSYNPSTGEAVRDSDIPVTWV
ncbi:hypothetical protein [Pseudomonas sp. RIT-PI-AD]|uniref:hypothetical protein n=1 Tax=Pseudomonas sp. RIT-PI-AD TaxID=3035294 RepID=UPI0021DB6FA2|nr:hypothetical protein [Pseudomonas sp. RIT-PI-AD]